MSGMEFFGRLVCSAMMIGLWILVNYWAVLDIADGKRFGPLIRIYLFSLMMAAQLWMSWAA